MGCHLPPGDLPDFGMEAASPTLAGRFSATESPGKPSSRFLTFSTAAGRAASSHLLASALVPVVEHVKNDV